MPRSGTLRALATACALSLTAAACASTGDVDNVRDDSMETRRLAEAADAKANAAAADAAAARVAAEAAAKDAKEANEKADRIFQRSLHK
jgi:hypothetical protein